MPCARKIGIPFKSPFAWCSHEWLCTIVRAQYVRMPNTYDSYVLGWNSHFWLKNELLSPIRTNGYDSQNLTSIDHPPSENFTKFTKDNLTHGNFVQGQLDPRQFRPRTTRPTAISSKDNSTHGNFVQGQLDPRQFRPRTTRSTAISSKDNSTNGNFVQIQSWLSLQGLVEGHPPPRRCYLRQLDQK